MGTDVVGGPEENLPGSSSAPPGVIEDGTLDEFFRTAVKHLLRYLLDRGVPLADAEELVPDAVMEVKDRWETVTYRYSYARTVVLNKWRQRLRENYRLQELQDRLRDGHEPVGDGGLGQAEDQERVDQLLGLLSPMQRAVARGLHEGYSKAEVAQRLGITGAAVSRHLHEARVRLRKALGPPPRPAARDTTEDSARPGSQWTSRDAQDWTRDGGQR